MPAAKRPKEKNASKIFSFISTHLFQPFIAAMIEFAIATGVFLSNSADMIELAHHFFDALTAKVSHLEESSFFETIQKISKCVNICPSETIGAADRQNLQDFLNRSLKPTLFFRDEFILTKFLKLRPFSEESSLLRRNKLKLIHDCLMTLQAILNETHSRRMTKLADAFVNDLHDAVGGQMKLSANFQKALAISIVTHQAFFLSWRQHIKCFFQTVLLIFREHKYHSILNDVLQKIVGPYRDRFSRNSDPSFTNRLLIGIAQPAVEILRILSPYFTKDIGIVILATPTEKVHRYSEIFRK